MNLLRACGLAALGLAFFAAEADADFMVDPFSHDLAINVFGGPRGSKSVFDSQAAPGAIGGEQEVLLERTSNNLGSLQADSNGSVASVFSLGTGPATTGRVTLTYDGIDGDPGLNHVGLGGVDVTEGGLNTGLIIEAASDLGILAEVTFYTDASHFSTITAVLPATGSTTTYAQTFLSFASFLPTGLGADFTNIGAIQIMFSNAGRPGADLGVSLIVAAQPFVPTPTTTVAEPSSWLLVGSSLAGAFVWSRRRARRLAAKQRRTTSVIKGEAEPYVASTPRSRAFP